jgi:O-antigen/teichoic acid export membrane protein
MSPQPPPASGENAPGDGTSPEDAPASNEHETEAREYTDRILEGATFIFSGSMVGKVVGLAIQLALGRGFGKALYGLYTTGMTVLRLGQSVATLGLQNGVIRFGAPAYERDHPEEVKGTFLAVAGLGLVSGTVFGVAIFVASPWLAGGVFTVPKGMDPALMERTISVFGLGLPFYVLTYLASRMARAVGTMQVDTLLDSILQPTLFLMMIGGVLLVGQNFTWALYTFLTSTVLAAGTSIYAIYRLFPPLFSRLAPAVDVRALLRFSIPIVGVTLATMGVTYTDRLMLAILRTPEAVGTYQPAAILAIQLNFILFAMTAAFSPIISDLYESGQFEDLSSLYGDTVRWIILLTLPAAIVLIVFAPQIISIWGTEYRNGASALRILAAAQFVVAGVGSVGQMLQMSDHQDYVFGVNASMAVLNVVLNWILIQWYGVNGAALATGITTALGDTAEVVGLYAFLSIHPFRWPLWKPFAAAGLATLLTVPLYTATSGPAQWALGIPVLLLAYGGALYGLGPHPKDASILAGLWRRLVSSGDE